MKLRTKKSYREETGKVMLCGSDLIQELGQFVEVATLFHVVDNEAAAEEWEPVAMGVSQAVMEKITGLETVPLTMLAAEIDLPRPVDFSVWEPGTLCRLLVLEGCQDPGNMVRDDFLPACLPACYTHSVCFEFVCIRRCSYEVLLIFLIQGTMIRSAVAFGWDGIFLLPGCVDPFNDKCIRASRGASFRIPISSGSYDEWLQVCNAHSLVSLAADMEKASHDHVVGESDLEVQASFHSSRVSLTVGSEGQGVSQDTLKHCTVVSIPMSGDMESLNVSAAASIFMCLLSPMGPLTVHTIQQALLRPGEVSSAQ